MNERKIIFFVLFVIVYCIYNVQLWFFGTNAETEPTQKTHHPIKKAIRSSNEVKSTLRVYRKDASSILEIFTNNPFICELAKKQKSVERMTADNNTIAVIGITVFLIALTLNAILDVIKVKEEERLRLKLNPEGERRQSLAEFANKKYLRRESSKFSLHLFQIAEYFVSSGEDKNTKQNTKPARQYTRGDSTNSYLSENKKKTSEGSAPASIGETAEPKLVKRQSVSKLFGGRPVPMVRRSSFPALPLNPEVQALMLGHKQSSFDSDDESDGKGRRVRIIRRY